MRTHSFLSVRLKDKHAAFTQLLNTKIQSANHRAACGHGEEDRHQTRKLGPTGMSTHRGQRERPDRAELKATVTQTAEAQLDYR